MGTKVILIKERVYSGHVPRNTKYKVMHNIILCTLLSHFRYTRAREHSHYVLVIARARVPHVGYWHVVT